MMATVTFGEVVFLPPEKVSFSQAASHQRVALMEVGEITQLCPPWAAGDLLLRLFPAARQLPVPGSQ